MRESRLDQSADLLVVAQLLQVRAQPFERTLHHLLGLDRLRMCLVIEERPGQSAARRLPHRRPLERHRDRTVRDPLLDVLECLSNGGPEEPSDHHRVVDDGARVADAQLQRRDVVGGAHVEVRHSGVSQDTGPDQVLDQAVVVGGRRQGTGGSSAGPALPHDRPDARVARVRSVPERGAGRERQENGQDPGDPLRGEHSQIPIGDPDVDLQPADELLVDEHAVLLLHHPVAAGSGEVEVLNRRQRCRPRGGQAQTLRGSRLGEGRPQTNDLRSQSLERGRGIGAGLHRGALHLGGEAGIRHVREQLRPRAPPVASSRCRRRGSPPRPPASAPPPCPSWEPAWTTDRCRTIGGGGGYCPPAPGTRNSHDMDSAPDPWGQTRAVHAAVRDGSWSTRAPAQITCAAAGPGRSPAVATPASSRRRPRCRWHAPSP